MGWLGPAILQSRSQAEGKPKVLGSIWILYPACPKAVQFFLDFKWAGLDLQFCSAGPKQKANQKFWEAFGFFTQPVQKPFSFLWILCGLALACNFCNTNPKQKAKQKFWEAFGFCTQPDRKLFIFFGFFMGWLGPAFLQCRSQAEGKTKVLGSILDFVPSLSKSY